MPDLSDILEQLSTGGADRLLTLIATRGLTESP